VKRRHGLAVLLICSQSLAAGLAPVVSNGNLGARIDSPEYPATLARDLQSGLTNRLYVRVSVLDGTRLLQQRAAEITIRYDLWEQNFTVTRTLEHDAPESQLLANLAEVSAYLASLRIPGLFAAHSLPVDRNLVLRGELLLNPISREKLRMIRKWVAENSTPDVGSDPGISTSNSLFNRIFEQYADGSDLAAAWRTEFVSPPFRPASLPNENL
jgi:hypothetical protein